MQTTVSLKGSPSNILTLNTRIYFETQKRRGERKHGAGKDEQEKEDKDNKCGQRLTGRESAQRS